MPLERCVADWIAWRSETHGPTDVSVQRDKKMRRVAREMRYAYLSQMTVFKFVVEHRQMPQKHAHTYVAVDVETREEIPLPRGGNGAFIGRYPEIQAHLEARGVLVNMTYTKRRGDIFDPDYTSGKYVWTFKTGSGVIVEDISRFDFEAIVESS